MVIIKMESVFLLSFFPVETLRQFQWAELRLQISRRHKHSICVLASEMEPVLSGGPSQLVQTLHQAILQIESICLSVCLSFSTPEIELTLWSTSLMLRHFHKKMKHL